MKFAYFLGGPNDLTKMVIPSNHTKHDFWFTIPEGELLDPMMITDEKVAIDTRTVEMHIAHYRLLEEHYDSQKIFAIYIFDGIEHA